MVKTKLPKSNEITIIRKRTVGNIPMFMDDTVQDQNEWYRVGDYVCVEYCPAQTAKVYELEHDQNNQNQDNTYYYEFSFESTRQEQLPPYDINSGDYIGFWQGTTKYFYRIVKADITPMFHNCCIVQIVVNITQPKEVNYLLECGVLRRLSDEDINDGSLPVGEESIVTDVRRKDEPDF